jgi:thiamine-phosphate pyrophosphorylase
MSEVPFDLRCRLRGLYVITDENLGGGHLAIARAALAGGAGILQLRDKSTPPRQLLAVAREMREMTHFAGALFLINDRLDLALLCGADGVHLGPDDWPVEDVRRILGPGKLIGVSCGTPEEAREATALGADYMGVGAVWGTLTKSDAGAAIGLDGLRSVMSASHLPSAAIGGVNAANLAGTLATGVPMACVISAVAGAGDEVAMERATRELCEHFHSRTSANSD